MSRPILLVHGAFHCGGCWGQFEPHLRQRGFEVHVLTLGGHECTDDAALPIASQRAMQTHMSFRSVQTLDTDHSPFLSTPAELADLIRKIAEHAQ